MNDSPAPVVIRPPVLPRLAGTAFILAWLGGVVWTTMVRHHTGASIPLGMVFVAVGAGMGYRQSRLGVTASSDGSLTIRNRLRTRVIAREDIEDFRFDGNPAGLRIESVTIRVLLRDRTMYGLDVTRTPAITRLGMRQAAERLAALRAWLRPAPDFD